MYFDFNYIINQLSSVSITDVIDILIVALIFFYLFRFVRERRAGKLAVGVIVFIAMLFLSELAQMRATHFILKSIANVGLIALIILFQPELRSMLEKMGGEPFNGFRGKLDKSIVTTYRVAIRELSEGVERLSQSKTGALIVIEGTTKLGDVIKTGTIVDAQITSFLLGNIFFNKAPLHDGAVIVRDMRIHSAGCFLPLSTNPEIIKDLGTRHRAGIGISENSDAIVIIVSEETGTVSIALDGKLMRDFNKESLEKFLTEALIDLHGGNKLFKSKFFGKSSAPKGDDDTDE